ncbi:MAG: hypothetical protein ACREQC_03245 [Candidatus Binataceae bacterium]
MLQVLFHDTVAAAVTVAAVIVQVLLSKQRLMDARASTTPGVWAIDVSPFRIECIAAIVVIGVVFIAVLIWKA